MSLDNGSVMEKLSIYVPSTYAVSANVGTRELKARVDRVMAWLTVNFGGATSDAPARGAYRASDGSTINEDVIIVSSLIDPDKLAANADLVLSFARELREAWHQESIMLTVERPSGITAIFVENEPANDTAVTVG